MENKEEVMNNLDFTARLFQQMPSGNLFFSPTSLFSPLAMVTVGARGETRTQMARVLGLEGMGDEEIVPMLLRETAPDLSKIEGATLLSANRIYAEHSYPFLDSFMDLMKQVASIELVDFINTYEQVRLEINNWVEGKTSRLIKNLLREGSLDRLTRMVLVNALYFKANWLSKFPIGNTKENDTFYLPYGKRVQVPMMHQSRHFPYLETYHFKVLALPYLGESIISSFTRRV